MKKLLIITSLFFSLQSFAQSKDTTAKEQVFVLKGSVEYYNALIDNLVKYKSVLVFAESPYSKVEIIDKLIADIKKQIEPQIKKPKE